MVTLKKLIPADQSFGRGIDNYRTSAWYAVLVDGRQVATIEPQHDRLGYMERQDWTVRDADTGQAVRCFCAVSGHPGGPFKAARAFALEHYGVKP